MMKTARHIKMDTAAVLIATDVRLIADIILTLFPPAFQFVAASVVVAKHTMSCVLSSAAQYY